MRKEWTLLAVFSTDSSRGHHPGGYDINGVCMRTRGSTHAGALVLAVALILSMLPTGLAAALPVELDPHAPALPAEGLIEIGGARDLRVPGVAVPAIPR
jgi:hypothetical protein